MEKKTLSLGDIQKAVDEWVNQFEEDYWSPLPMFAENKEKIFWKNQSFKTEEQSTLLLFHFDLL